MKQVKRYTICKYSYLKPYVCDHADLIRQKFRSLNSQEICSLARHSLIQPMCFNTLQKEDE